MALGKVINFSDLGPDIKSLLNSSLTTRELAYTPYSNFKVGAAVLTKNGNIHSGCNVENASYGLTICAERTALVKAVSSNEKEILAVGVSGIYNGGFLPPCGACRQFIREFASNLDMPIYLCLPDKSKKPVLWSDSSGKSIESCLLHNSFIYLLEHFRPLKGRHQELELGVKAVNGTDACP